MASQALLIGPLRRMCLEADALVVTSRLDVGASRTMTGFTLLLGVRVVREISGDVMTGQAGFIPDLGCWPSSRLLLIGLLRGRLLGRLVLANHTGDEQ